MSVISRESAVCAWHKSVVIHYREDSTWPQEGCFRVSVLPGRRESYVVVLSMYFCHRLHNGNIQWDIGVWRFSVFSRQITFSAIRSLYHHTKLNSDYSGTVLLPIFLLIFIPSRDCTKCFTSCILSCPFWQCSSYGHQKRKRDLDFLPLFDKA